LFSSLREEGGKEENYHRYLRIERRHAKKKRKLAISILYHPQQDLTGEEDKPPEK